MPGNKRPRKPKPANPIGPPKSIKEFARQYRCSHCHSHVDGIVKDPSGIWRMMICHSASCPVLRGTLTDVPDTLRAAVAAGGVTGVIAGPFGGGLSE
jgi:hypothetical protein